MSRKKGLTGPLYTAGYNAASEDFKRYGWAHVTAIASRAKDFPLDWFLVGYKTRVQLATESAGR